MHKDLFTHNFYITLSVDQVGYLKLKKMNLPYLASLFISRNQKETEQGKCRAGLFMFTSVL